MMEVHIFLIFSKTGAIDQSVYLDLNNITALRGASRDYNLHPPLVLICSLFNSS